MNRRKFIQASGAAISGTAFYLAQKEVKPVSAQSIILPSNLPDLKFAPDMRKSQADSTGYNSEQWGSDVIAYTHTPQADESYRTYQPHQLVYMCTFMVANVVDKDGVKYNLLRTYEASDSIIVHGSRAIPDGVTYAQELFKPGEMALIRINHEMIDKNTIQVTPYLADPNLVNIQRESQKAAWKDVSGRVDLQYKSLGPALEYYCPGLVEDDMYRSEPYWIKGTIDGKSVQGYGVIDTAWGPAGTDWVQSKIFRYLEENWVVWANVFEDDSIECGVFMSGVDHFGCGYYNQNGQALVSGRSDAQVTWTPDGFIQQAGFTVGGMPFEFIMDARIIHAPGYLSWASGSVHRIGDNRKPKMSFAWFEFLPKR